MSCQSDGVHDSNCAEEAGGTSNKNICRKRHRRQEKQPLNEQSSLKKIITDFPQLHINKALHQTIKLPVADARWAQ